MQHVRILREEGVSLDRLVVGHTDEHAEINVLSELAELGCYVQFDVVNKTHYLLDLTRAKLIRELIRRGHLNQILLGTDRCRRVELYEERGGVGYTYILETFVGMLEAEGVSSAEIDRISRVNPGEMLAYS
jgi:phosphotriesterase-related protein